MKIRIATLCDFAQVREGLLFISSAGITRMNRAQFPSPLGIMLVVVFEVSPDAVRSFPHEMRFRLENEDGKRLMEGGGAFQLDSVPGDLDSGEPVLLNFVADIRNIPLPEPGRYQVVIDTVSDAHIALGFRAQQS